MKLTYVFLAIVLALSVTPSDARDPDETRTFKQLIESRGFQLLDYNITTADGYRLTIHRVVPAVDFNATEYTKTRKPVVVFHGLMASSNIFFINSPEDNNSTATGDNFGFTLLETGRYDIWLPNARANGVSSGHVSLSTNDPKYWQFSWQQIALYDVPAVIDFVREKTGHQTVAWVGHSQGAGTMFAMLSLNQSYAQYIRPFIAWAPAVYLGNGKSPFLWLLGKTYKFVQPLGGQFLLSGQYIGNLAQMLCRPEISTTSLCSSVFETLFGKSTSLNETRIPVYNHFMTMFHPYSTWQVTHYGQIHSSGRFAQFDYLKKLKNFAVYRKASPPDFPLTAINADVPIIIMNGNTDAFVDPLDIAKLELQLRGNIKRLDVYTVPLPVWSHTDFVLGTGAGSLVYDKTIHYLDKYCGVEDDGEDDNLPSLPLP